MRAFLLLPLIALLSQEVAPRSVDNVESVPDSVVRYLQIAAGQQSKENYPRAVAAAIRFARQYQKQTGSDFLVSQIHWFEAAGAAKRKAFISADSLRRLGNQLLPEQGPAVSMRIWREAIRQADIAGNLPTLASTYVSIAGGFYRSGQLDSAELYVTNAIRTATKSGDTRTRANGLGLLASIRRDQGNAQRAIALYEEATQLRRKIADSRGIAADLNNIALIARDNGELDKASLALKEALEINRAARRLDLVSLNLANLGTIESDRRNPRASDSLFRLALSTNRTAANRADRPFILADYARVQAQRGYINGAIASFREAIDLHDKTGAPNEAINTRIELANLLAAAGEYDLARNILDNATLAMRASHLEQELAGEILAARAAIATQLGIYRQADSLFSEASSRIEPERLSSLLHERARLSYVRGNARAALDLVQSARKQMTDVEPAQVAQMQVLTGLALHELNRANWRSPIDSAISYSIAARDHLGEAAARSSLGDILLRDKPRQAELEYRRGLALLGNIRVPDLRWQLQSGIGFAQSRQGQFASAATSLHRAIEIIESSAGSIRTPENRFGFLHDKWITYAELAQIEAGRGRVVEAFDLSERMRARQLVEMVNASDRAEISRRETGSNVMQALAEDEILIEYLLGDSTSTAFVVTRSGIHAVTLRIARSQISQLADFARRAMQSSATSEKTDYWKAPLSRLYNEIILPIESRGYLDGKKRVIIVPHADLHYVSFASLTSRTGRFLVDQLEVSYAPSAEVWLHLKGRTPKRRQVLAFAPDIGRLPATKREVRALKTIYGERATVTEGGDATKNALRLLMPSSSIIHLATFGVMNRMNPLGSYVMLGGLNSKLKAAEVIEWPLSGQLVVLSACRTGIGAGMQTEIPPGEDWVGLMQGFLQGGASGVIASLWPVDDEATSRLMMMFHRSVRDGLSASRALALAQRSLSRDPRFRSPFYWAGFTLNGQYNDKPAQELLARR
jgi:CHAT domain-containing protein